MSNTTHRACARPPDEKDTFLNDRRLNLQSLEISKIKIRKKCFSYFYFWNFKRLWTHNHRLVKYMYMSMRRCDARLQAVPNPYYCICLCCH